MWSSLLFFFDVSYIQKTKTKLFIIFLVLHLYKINRKTMILWNDMLKDAFVWLISNPWLFFSIGAVLLFMEHWKFIGFVVALGYILMKCLPVVMKCLPVVMKSVFSWMQRILFKFWVLCFDNQRNVKTKTFI